MHKWWYPSWMASHDHGIHSCKEFVLKGSDYLQRTLERVHTRRSSTHNKRREDGNNWRSSDHDSKKIPQVMRNMKNSILEEPLMHIDHLDKKWFCCERRRWWSWKKESTHETNKDKYSIVISWYCFVMHLFIFNWCIMHDRMFALMTIYY